MENKLEQSLMYAPMPTQETREVQRVYRTEDLVSLSASALYSKESEKKLYDKFIDETWREDNDDSIGDHINYEVWMKRTGSKEGRNKKMSNAHIILPPSSGSRS